MPRLLVGPGAHPLPCVSPTQAASLYRRVPAFPPARVQTVSMDVKAMVLEAPGQALIARERPLPTPGPGQLLIEVSACGVCRTDLHLLDGELPEIRYPIVHGHQIVGRVQARGEGVERVALGARVGVPWLGF